MGKNTLKKLVVTMVIVTMAISLFPATTFAASTNTSLYRKAKSMQQKLTGNAEYFGYYTEVKLKSNSSTKVVWKLKYTNTENNYFDITQTTIKKSGRIKTVYKNKWDNYTLTYKELRKSLADYKTRNGYAMMEKSSILADDLIESAEKNGWTVSETKGHAKSSEGSTTFKATNKAKKVYRVSVARVAINSKKSVKTVYRLNDKVTSKKAIINCFKKYA